MTPGFVNLAETTVLKDGNAFAVTHRDGSLPAGGGHPLGVWRDDCRHLDAYELRIEGEEPVLLGTHEGPPGTAVVELANPPLVTREGAELPLQAVHLRIERELGEAGLTDRLSVTASHRAPLRLRVGLRLRADLAPMLAVRGAYPLPGRDRVEAATTAGGARFSAVGADGERRGTVVEVSPAPAHDGEPGDLEVTLDLEPGRPAELSLSARFEGPQSAAAPEPAPPAARIETDDELLRRVLARAMTDLDSLRSRMDGQDYYAAGVPWYSTLFGRDSLITAGQMLALAPEVAERTLRLLAGRLGERSDPEHEEDPGKVVHEVRPGEAAAPGLTPLAAYYGTVDATPLFGCLLADHAEWTGDLALFEELRPAVEATLDWIDGPGDRDGDGLLDYAARAPGGLRNQGWKDSPDGIPDEHGVPLEPPIAVIEAQAYAIRARRGLARLFRRAGDHERADTLEAAAADHAERLERFWLEDRGCYAMALDGAHRPSRAVASNQGHLLWAGVLEAGRARAVRDTLMDPRTFSGWGLRTLAEGEAAHSPIAYHLGSVWPHDTAMAAAGLRRHGFDGDFLTLLDGLLEAAAASPHLRLAELFAGFPRSRSGAPVPYPAACQPQAWAAGAIPYLLVCGLGLEADGFARRLVVRRPVLPSWASVVEVSGLRVGGGRADLRFERDGDGGVVLAAASAKGGLEITVERSPCG